MLKKQGCVWLQHSTGTASNGALARDEMSGV